MNHSITTRAMLHSDLNAVSSILDDTGLFPSEMLAEMAEPFLSETQPHVWLAACDGPDILGFAYCEPERMTVGTFNLLAIAVDPDRQSGGIGQLMVMAVEQAVRDLGGRVLLVETSSLPDYERTRSFYVQLGYDREALEHNDIRLFRLFPGGRRGPESSRATIGVHTLWTPAFAGEQQVRQ